MVAAAPALARPRARAPAFATFLASLPAFLAVIALALPGPVHAGPRYAFRALGTAEGLGNLSVTALAQGRDGVLWVGTENGLYRFTGERFTRIVADGADARGLVGALHVDGKGRVWASTSRGIFRVAGDHLEPVATGAEAGVWHGQYFASVRLSEAGPERLFVVTGNRLSELDDTDGHPPPLLRAVFAPALVAAEPELAHLSAVAAGPGGALWLGCGQGLCRWDGTHLRRWGAAEGIPPARWAGLLPHADGTVWARSDHDLLTLDPVSGRVTHRLPAFADRGAVHVPLPIVADPRGRVVTFADDGLAVADGDRWLHVDASTSLVVGGSVNALLAGADGELWIGTGGRGLVLWPGSGGLESYTRAEGLPHDDVWTFLRDSRGTLRVGTGEGVAIVGDEVTRARTGIADADTRQVGAMAEDRTGALWTSTFSGLLARTDPKTGITRTAASLPLVMRLAVDTDGALWIATNRGLQVIDHPEVVPAVPRVVDEANALVGVKDPPVSGACRSPDGTMWFAAGPVLLQRVGNSWRRVTIADPRTPGKDVSDLASLACDADGSVWAGELDAMRLWHVHGVPRGQPGQPVTADDVTPRGFEDRRIGAVLRDRRGWTWLNTDRGVLVGNGKRWREVTQDDGLVWNDTNQNALYEDTDGSVWVGTSAGATHIERAAPLFDVPTRPVVLESLRRDGVPIAPAPGLSMPWSRGALDVAISFPVYRHDPDRVLRARLAGLEDEWSSYRDLALHYPALPPGHYRLELEVWQPALQARSPRATLEFDVETPWWRGVPAWVGGIVLGALALWRLETWRTRRLSLRQRELEALVAERTRELEASHEQMRALALRDALTGTWNRRAVTEALEREHGRCVREGRPLTVVMIDVDHFKRVNDTQGHPAGDAVLREIARRLERCVRAYDVLGRYGGEEFMLVLPDLSADRPEGLQRIEGFRRAVSDAPMDAGGLALKVTCSLGAATAGDASSSTPAALVARADVALYAAKAAGRDRVVVG